MTRPTDRRPNESPEDTVADNYNAAGCRLWRFRGSGTGKTEENLFTATSVPLFGHQVPITLTGRDLRGSVTGQRVLVANMRDT